MEGGWGKWQPLREITERIPLMECSLSGAQVGGAHQNLGRGEKRWTNMDPTGGHVEHHVIVLMKM